MNSNARYLCALGVLAAATAAGADTVDVKFKGAAEGRNVRVTLNGGSMNVFAGQLTHNLTNGSGLGAKFDGDFITFCTELTQYVTSSTSEYRVTPPDDISTPAMGASKAAALENLYAFAGDSAMKADADQDYAAAFQIAIWEIVYDYDSTEGVSSLDVSTGAFKAEASKNTPLSSAIQSHLNDFFNAAFIGGPHNVKLYGLWNESHQDQLIMEMIPLPGAGLMGLAGMGVLAARRRRI